MVRYLNSIQELDGASFVSTGTEQSEVEANINYCKLPRNVNYRTLLLLSPFDHRVAQWRERDRLSNYVQPIAG